jgi:hypothetical protein
MTTEEQAILSPADADALIKAYLDAVMLAFQEKVNAYYTKAGADLRKRFLHMMDVKNALKSIGSPDTFGIGAAADYTQCQPPRVCTGGNCMGQQPKFTDDQLVALAGSVGVSPKDLFVH